MYLVFELNRPEYMSCYSNNTEYDMFLPNNPECIKFLN